MKIPSFSKAKYLNASSLDEERTGYVSDRCVCNKCVFVRKTPFEKLYFYGLLIPFFWVYLILLYLSYFLFAWNDPLENYGIAFPPEHAFPTVFEAQQHIENNFFEVDLDISNILADNSNRINNSDDSHQLGKAVKHQAAVELDDYNYDEYTATTENEDFAKFRFMQERLLKQAITDVVASHFFCENVTLKWAARALASICFYSILAAMIVLSVNFETPEDAY